MRCQSRHVENAAHRCRLREDVRRFCCAEKNGTDGNAAASRHSQKVICDVAGIQIGHHQKIGFSRQGRVRKDAVEHPLRQRGIAVHLSFDREIGRSRLNERERVAHFL